MLATSKPEKAAKQVNKVNPKSKKKFSNMEDEVAYFRSKIIESFEHNKSEEILPKLMHSIIHQVFKYLSLNTEKQKYIQALCDIVVCFICDSNLEKLLSEEAYKKAIYSLSQFFEVNDEELTFIIEVLSGNPYRIFG